MGLFGKKNDSQMPSESDEESGSSATQLEKENQLETLHTNERVGTHVDYFEKGGLRTEGDGQDHVGAHHKVRFPLRCAWQRA